MIYTDKEHGITSAQLAKFQKALEATKGRLSDKDWFKQAEIDSLESQISKLEAEIAEYDRLKSGQVSLPKSCALEELPRVLVQTRIASGMSQTDLAKMLNMKTQQVQRYEAMNYKGATIARLTEVSRALGMKILGTVKAMKPTRSNDGTVTRPRRRLAI